MQRREVLLGMAGVAGSLALTSACAHPMSYATTAQRQPKDGVVHVGNSTHLFVLDGVHILTDPWLKDPADKVLQHRVPPAPLPTDVDVVLVTHAHEDHFDTTALALIDKKATIVVPTWMEADARALGFAHTVTVKAGDVIDVPVDVGAVHLEVVKALHDIDEVAFRFRVGDAGNKRVFFGGDTLPNPEIKAFAQAGCDFAVLPADAGALMGKRFVSNVAEAIALATDFGVNAAGKGAMLTHHEFELTSAVWNVFLDVKPVDATKLPPWFLSPVPGQYVPYPWM